MAVFPTPTSARTSVITTVITTVTIAVIITVKTTVIITVIITAKIPKLPPGRETRSPAVRNSPIRVIQTSVAIPAGSRHVAAIPPAARKRKR